jgi:hypothetical protein
VEDLPPELSQPELTMTALRNAIEERLRSGRIPVYASQATNASDAKAYVYVHLAAVALPDHMRAISVDVDLRQTVQSLATRSNIVNAMTWEHHTVAVASDAEGAALRDLILEMVDDFVADWRAVH